MDIANLFYLIVIGMISLLFIFIIFSGILFVLIYKRKTIYDNKIKEADNYKKEAEQYSTDIKKKTDMYYKKLIQLTPKELDDYLGLIFGYFLELNNEARVSEKDPEVVTKLYANTLSSMLDYIGSDTIEALDYYYGKEYLEKWCQLRYLLLENRRTLSKVINKSYDFTAIQNNTPGE